MTYRTGHKSSGWDTTKSTHQDDLRSKFRYVSGNIGNGENIMTVVNTEYSLWLFHDIYLPQEYTRVRLLSHIHVGQIRKVFVFTQHQNTTLALNVRAWYWAKISCILNCKEFKWNMVSVTFIINSSKRMSHVATTRNQSRWGWDHYNDVMMGAMATHFVYSNVYSRRRPKKTSKLHVTGNQWIPRTNGQ